MSSKISSASGINDPFDTSDIKNTVVEAEVVTVSLVDRLEKEAKALFSSQRNRAAAEALALFANKANSLAEIIISGNQPYYIAPHADQQKCSNIPELARFENMADEFRSKRNRAMIMQAECLIAIGEQQAAVHKLTEVLKLLAISDKTWWDRARKALYGLAGVAL